MPNPDDIKYPLPKAWYDEHTCSKIILTYKELHDIIEKAILEELRLRAIPQKEEPKAVDHCYVGAITKEGNQWCDSCGGWHPVGQKEEPKQECKQTRWPCGCVSCTCEDGVQCHGCGAKNCGLRTCVRKSPSTSQSECEVEELARILFSTDYPRTAYEDVKDEDKEIYTMQAKDVIKAGYSKLRRDGK